MARDYRADAQLANQQDVCVLVYVIWIAHVKHYAVVGFEVCHCITEFGSENVVEKRFDRLAHIRAQ
jgi:hypothetical protein